MQNKENFKPEMENEVLSKKSSANNTRKISKKDRTQK